MPIKHHGHYAGRQCVVTLMVDQSIVSMQYTLRSCTVPRRTLNVCFGLIGYANRPQQRFYTKLVELAVQA